MCATQRVYDFETTDLELGIHIFKTFPKTGYNILSGSLHLIISSDLNIS